MVGVAILAWSTRHILLGPSATFFGAYGAILVTTEFLTAATLFARAREHRSRRATILACAYTLSWPLILGNVATLPATSGTTFGFQTPPWMWAFWHLGWAALICAYTWTPERREQRSDRVIGAAFAVSLIAVACALGATAMLPALLLPNGAFTSVLWSIYAIAIGLDVIALVRLLRNFRQLSDLELWVAIAIVAAIGEIFLIASSLVRFSMGSYVGRILSLISGLAVLISVAGDSIRSARRAAGLERSAAVERAKADHDIEFRALGDSVPQILWTATADGSIDWYNKRWYDYTGQTHDEAAGWGWQSVHHPEDLPEVMREWPESIARGSAFEMEFRLRGADGKFRWFLTRIAPFRNSDGRVIRWFGSNTDIDVQRRNADRDKRIASMMQDAFLPQSLPVHENFTLDATYWPAESDAVVGGDWYDAFLMPDGRLLISIGDVAGHGLDAAIVAGRLRQTIFTQAIENDDPGAVLVMADRVLRAQSDTIATALLAYFDPLTGDITYASAGHPAPIVVMPEGARILSAPSDGPLGTGFATGGTLTIGTHSVTLSPRALVALYTDGAIEFERNIDTGERQLLCALQSLANDSAPLSAEAVLKSIFCEKNPSDDVALLLLRFSAKRLHADTREQSLSKTWRFHSSHAQSAYAARHELTGFLRQHAAHECDLYNTELILGELLANTVEHAPGLVEVRIDWTADRPILRLRDSGPGLAELVTALPSEALAEDGRGLFLIRMFAERFEMQAAPGFGTEFIVELPIHRSGQPTSASRLV